MDMRNGCKKLSPQEYNLSIAKGTFALGIAFFVGKSADFKSARICPLLRRDRGAQCFVIPGHSVTINTSVFYLLKRRKTHGSEV